jgi:dienelactone hydrolase
MTWEMLLVVGLALAAGRGTIHTEAVQYKHGDVTCAGYLAYEEGMEGKRPGVVVIPEWWGLNDYAKYRAQELAKLGYVAMAIDMYGNGKVAAAQDEAGKLASAMRSDRPLMRARAAAGVDALKKQPQCDATRIAAIGYCFGGGTALELARSGADINGVVSFHGNLDTPNPNDAKNIKCKVLVCAGADDRATAIPAVTAFMDEMRNAKVDYQLLIYGGAVHGFTNPNAGNNVASGYAYNADAGRRSWQDMQDFFNEIFK